MNRICYRMDSILFSSAGILTSEFRIHITTKEQLRKSDTVPNLKVMNGDRPWDI